MKIWLVVLPSTVAPRNDYIQLAIDMEMDKSSVGELSLRVSKYNSHHGKCGGARRRHKDERLPTRFEWVCVLCVQIGTGHDVLWCNDVTVKNIDTRVLATREMQTVAHMSCRNSSQRTNKDNAIRWVRFDVAPLGGVRQTAQTLLSVASRFK